MFTVVQHKCCKFVTAIVKCLNSILGISMSMLCLTYFESFVGFVNIVDCQLLLVLNNKRDYAKEKTKFVGYVCCR